MSERRKALIVFGGWEGHEPEKVSARFKSMLEAEGFEVRRENSKDVLDDGEELKKLHLFIPIWTGDSLDSGKTRNVIEAVAAGTGIAGCHGGMCDAFRENTEWQFMTGGQWVSHPGGELVYRVNIKPSSSPITFGIKDFEVKSEQYYMHVDPAIEVLATTVFPTHIWYHASNGIVQMPVVWTKRWGVGRVFYNSLGHHDDVFEIPEAAEIMRRGMLWAAEGKDVAASLGLTPDEYRSSAKMF